MKLNRPLAAIATVALLAIPTAASADTIVRGDARGDVQVVKLDKDGDVVGEAAPAPDRAQGDATGVKVTHTKKSVRVLTRYRDLVRSGYQLHQLEIRTGSRARILQIEALPGSWKGKATLYTWAGKKARCSTSHTIDYAKNTVLAVVPSKCLGNPTWVRIGSGAITSYDGNQLYFDDALVTGGTFDSPNALTGRVYR
ncbi:hypothetical protein EFK50_09925 [Nocardioides marmoriginsengisoli]|uniref:Uncharacterized protein n=1 Tax=Nocardioides marmoriginsengisoli TaxID=661483 RepID=A0A3N0CFA4_9ACTN|nr:hypothetical protein [Nocardioides marmoriginsengisoli]RNL62118.1 hypothetical protein EFK50_09925 [Nocardioides marmoriginsengisoli]